MPATQTSSTTELDFQPILESILIEQKDALNDLVKQLTQADRFVAVRGVAGSGKSVFLTKQLIPFLTDEQSDDQRVTDKKWRSITFTPQINPIGALADALSSPGVLRPPGENETSFHQEITAALRSGKDGLINLVEDAIDRAEKPFKLLIVVDELKQLFELHENLIKSKLLEFANLHHSFKPGDDSFKPEDDELFFRLLHKAIRSDLPIYVVFSISNDSFGKLNHYQDWPELISLNRFPLPEIEAGKVKNALFLPVVESAAPLHPTLEKIYHELNDRYREDRPGNSIARLNMVLALLSGEHRSAFPSEKNIATLKSKSFKPDEAYFRKIDENYQQIKRSKDEIDYLCSEVYKSFNEVEKLLVERIFKAISVKDPTPGKVAQSVPCSFKNLVEICFRNGEEYPGIRDKLEPKQDLSSVPNTEKKNVLKQLIKRLTFTSPHLPDLVRVIDPGSASNQGKLTFSDDAIIDLGKENLIKEWLPFQTWVEEEHLAYSFYKNISDEAIAARANQVNTEDNPTKEAAKEEVFPLFSFFTDRWKHFRQSLFSIFAATQEETDEGSEKVENKLLSEGKIEITKDWFTNEMPSSAWVQRYLAPKLKKGDLTGQLAEANRLSSTSLGQVVTYYQDSRTFREQARNLEKSTNDRKEKITKRFLWVILSALLVALIFIAYGIYQSNRAKNAEANLELLEFVDKMGQVALLADGAYESGGLQLLKRRVEQDKKIKTKTVLIDSLASWGKINLRPISNDNVHRNTAVLAMLQVDSLGKRRYTSENAKLIRLAESVIDNANSLSTTKGTSYQYPAVYKALEETEKLLRTSLEKDRLGTPLRQSGVLHRSYSKIQTVVSNPVVKGQFVAGDDTGNVQLFENDTDQFDKLEKIDESISAMCYSRNGNKLYVSSFAGEFYRYGPFTSEIQPTSPRGFATNLKPIRINLVGQRPGQRKFPILSIHATASENHLLIQDDVGISLVRLVNNNQYVKEKYIDLTGKVKALTAIASNEDGTKFIVAGADASAVITFNFSSSRRLKTEVDIKVISHSGTSISAIAFEDEKWMNSHDQPIALGTETGQIVLTGLDFFESLGGKFADPKDTRFTDYFSSEEAENRFAITHLAYNKAGNHQLISVSMEGSVWMRNLDLIPEHEVYNFYNNGANSYWDEVKLWTGQSVNDACLINENLFVTVEHNSIRTWRTNLLSLKKDVEEVLFDFRKNATDGN